MKPGDRVRIFDNNHMDYWRDLGRIVRSRPADSESYWFVRVEFDGAMIVVPESSLDLIEEN